MNRKSEKGKVLGLRGDALVISLTELIHDTGLHLTAAFWSLYVLNLGGSLAIIGLFGLISGLGNIFFQPLCGYVSDKIGRKKPVVLGGFFVAIGPFIEAGATHWTGLILGRVIDSFDEGLWSARQALFAGSVDPERRGFSFATFYTIMSITSSIMPLIGGIVLDVFGMNSMRILLVIAGSVKILQSILNSKFLKEQEKSTSSDKPFRVSAEKIMRLNPSSVKGFIREMFEPVTNQKALQVMIVASTAASVSIGLVQSFNVIFVIEYIGLSKTEWGLAQSASSFANMFFRIPLGRITDKYGRKWCILADYAFRPMYTLLFVHIQNFTQLVTLNVFNIFLQDIGSSAWQALMTDLTPIDKRGRLFGTFGMTRSIFVSICPSIGAILWTTYGPVLTFYFVVVLRLIVTLFVFAFLKEPKTREI